MDHWYNLKWITSDTVDGYSISNARLGHNNDDLHLKYLSDSFTL